MKPFRSLQGLSGWLLRAGLVLFIIEAHYKTFIGFNYKVSGFYFSLLFLMAGLLLFIGGFLKNSSLTVVSGFVLFILSIINIILVFNGVIGEYLLDEYIILSLALFFLSNGNKRS